MSLQLISNYLVTTFCYPPTNRGHNSTNAVSYCYQLCSLTSDPTLGAGFQPMSMVFHHTRVEDYNWNYLDQHICGHSDFEELGEVRDGE